MLPDFLVGEDGFGDVGRTLWLVQILYSTSICVFPFIWEVCQIKRHSFIFHPRGVLLHFGIRGAPSRGSSDPTVADDVGN